MELTVKDLGDLTIYAGAVAGAIAAISVVFRYAVLQPLKRWIRAVLVNPLGDVVDQVKPNAGASLNDKITRIEAKVTALDKRMDDHLRLTHRHVAGRRGSRSAGG